MRHNEIQDVTATLLCEVTLYVEVEPTLQPVTGENEPSISQSGRQLPTRHEMQRILVKLSRCILRSGHFVC